MPKRKILVNLSPADIRKKGTSFDLAIAVGILAASGQVPQEALTDYILSGELGLDGTLQPFKGPLPVTIRGRSEGYKGILLPERMPRSQPSLIISRYMASKR